MNQLSTDNGNGLRMKATYRIPTMKSQNLRWVSVINLILLLACTFLISCKEEYPVRVIGKVTHAVTGDAIEEIEIRVENIICSEFAPIYCDQQRLLEKTNANGEFDFSFFQDCDSEIYAETPNDSKFYGHKKFVYNELAGRQDELSCNNRPMIYGEEGYYYEITLQPQMYVDVYAVDDPNLDLTSFTFNGEELQIVKSSHFQKRFKIDIDSYSGDFMFISRFSNASETKDYIPYNYLEEDDFTYELRY